MDSMKLEDCCEILDSQRVPITGSDRTSGDYPYYGANGIQDYVDDFIFDDELVLLAEDGGNFGSKTRPIAYRVSGKCWVNNHAHVLKPKAGLDVDYLCYSLMFYDVGGMVNGATRQKLTQAAMRQMIIPKRSLDEQIEIVNIIKKVQGVIASRKEELEQLDLLIKARFVELFGDININDKNWKYEPLGELCTIVRGGSPRPIEQFLGGDVPWIKIGDATDGDSIYLNSTKEQIIQMLIIYQLKNNLSIQEIKDLLTPIYENNDDLSNLYDHFIDIKHSLNFQLQKMIQKIMDDYQLKIENYQDLFLLVAILSSLSHSLTNIAEMLIETKEI